MVEPLADIDAQACSRMQVAFGPSSPSGEEVEEGYSHMETCGVESQVDMHRWNYSKQFEDPD